MSPRSRTVLARALAIAGSALVGVSLAAPLVAAAILLAVGGGLHLDYLMPGELFIVVLIGAAVLIAAALVTRRHRALIILLSAGVALLLALTDLLAAVTGLASGAVAATGLPLALVLGCYALYVAAIVALLAAGIVLCRESFAAPIVPRPDAGPDAPRG